MLETAGKFWVYEKVKTFRAISNGLSIEEVYDGINKDAIDYAYKKKWIKKNETFNFKKAYSQYWMPKLASCEYRRNASEQQGRRMPTFTVQDAFNILRSHSTNPFLPSKSTTQSICMHASGLLCPHQSVGSMVVELRKQKPATVWLTGTSAPCLSFFKPFYLGTDVLKEENVVAPGAIADNSYWWQWEKLHRSILKNYNASIDFIQFKQKELEQLWIKQDNILTEENWNLINAKHISLKALKETNEIRDYVLSKAKENKTTETDFFYNQFWKRTNKKVAL